MEDLILEFIKNRKKKNESTAPRHIHIRFGIEIEKVEKILEKLFTNQQISKFYDLQYQEERYLPKIPS